MTPPHIIDRRSRRRFLNLCFAAIAAVSLTPRAEAAESSPHWDACGWGGGGFFYSAVYHPTQKGVIYMGGDVAGVYKTVDNARTWRMINNGLAGYGVFSLAVDNKNPDTVYAATVGGLCKSTDAGENWALLPGTGLKDLRITGEKAKSIRCIAVSPADSKTIYVGSPRGKVFKTVDGGQNWASVYEKSFEKDDPSVLRIQFGKVNEAFFGGLWIPFTFPTEAKPETCIGFGFSFKGDKSRPKQSYVTVTTTTGGIYRSKDLSDLFMSDQWQDVVLESKDFAIDPGFADRDPEKAKGMPSAPVFSTVKRMDFTCNGPLPTTPSVARLEKIFFAVTGTVDGKTASANKPILLTAKTFIESKRVATYGNVRVGDPVGGAVYTMAVAAKDPNMVIAATDDRGLLQSLDAGQTWQELNAPKRAASVAIDPTDPNIIYGTFFMDGVWKSMDKGKTWNNISGTISPKIVLGEIAISPANPLDVYVIGLVNWNGMVFISHDAGKTWANSSSIMPDLQGNPTAGDWEPNKLMPLSRPTNIAINPLNPKELFVSANWRSCLSEDGGVTWAERNRGADITCVQDIRFNGDKTYVCAMDEGSFVSEDNGKNWRKIWARTTAPELDGHYWRVAVNNINGKERVIATVSPWNRKYTARVLVSDDGGKNYQVCPEGLPDYTIGSNVMWDAGYPRALSVDPKNPEIVYLGIDGDPSNGKMGGGIFKSVNGGHTWNQLPNQPASRRMFFGLMVDPTDSKRIYWGACAKDGGLYSSEDGGDSWNKIFSGEDWVFNLLVTNDGTVYCPGKNLWKSPDHGKTWQKLTNFTNGRTICGLEVNPLDPKTIWISTVIWLPTIEGAIYKTTDGGATWSDITGNIPFIEPLVLRFNPKTNELWAGGVSLHKIKQ